MSSTVRVERDVLVPMRDGVELATDVYLPEGDGPFPTLLSRIRGSRSSGFITGVLILNPLESVKRGYAVVLQEVRGRGGSGAAWQPFVHETRDGEDCLDWLVEQPFCDGRVGVYGTAYSASNALYLTALGREEIKACAVLGTGADIHDGWIYTSGAFELGWNVYWAYMTLSESIARLDVDEKTRARLKRDYVDAIRRAPAYAARLPISDHPLLQEGRDLQYHEWLEHPDYDDYWRAINVLESADRMRAPMLSIIGWHDNFLRSHFDLYHALAPNAPHQLVCGPWEHTNYVSPFSTSRTGAIEFGPDATCGVSLSTPLCLDWFDRWLKGADTGAAGGVRYWQLGEDEWRETASWPPPHTEQRWYLRSGGRANTLDGDGYLSTSPPGDEPADSYLYDPLDPTPTIAGKLLMPTIMMAGIEDQTPAEEREDVLCYTSPLLLRPLPVNGRIRVELWAATSAVDTDFTAKLCDVDPDGFVALLADGIVRGRHRESPRTRSAPLRPGEPTLFSVDLWDLAHTFLPGHRIRVEISSSNFPRFDRNLNTGNEIGEDGEEDAISAAQQVFHDATRPSALVLPVASG
ncbi:MAG: CocE/NonD family hydrolase [Actinobacteria bacterium]|nr:CocE/NonD family hydrolase [Actinomycetota bacterium]